MSHIMSQTVHICHIMITQTFHICHFMISHIVIICYIIISHIIHNCHILGYIPLVLAMSTQMLKSINCSLNNSLNFQKWIYSNVTLITAIWLEIKYNWTFLFCLVQVQVKRAKCRFWSKVEH